MDQDTNTTPASEEVKEVETPSTEEKKEEATE